MPGRALRSALADRPEIARDLNDHLRLVIEGGTAGRATKELCAAMAAAVNFCEPQLVEHRRAARNLGVTIAQLNALWDFARSALFSEAERAALSAAVALSREPRALPPAVWASLREHYDDGQIAEILCTIGAINYVSRLHNAVDSEL